MKVAGTNLGRRHLAIIGFLMLIVILTLGACRGGGINLPGGGGGEENVDRGGEVNELAEPEEDEDVGEGALGGANESHEATWDNYLRDMIAEQVSDRQQKVSILERYENPGITEQNRGGLVTDVDLVEDRTVFNLTNGGTIASANTDFDVRLSYANGDSETRTCAPFVSMEQDSESGLWYVVNPGALQIFAVCVP
jgi:hypothetical protein